MQSSPGKIELSSFHQSQMGSTQKSQFFPNDSFHNTDNNHANKMLESIDNANTSKYYVLNKPKNIAHLGSAVQHNSTAQASRKVKNVHFNGNSAANNANDNVPFSKTESIKMSPRIANQPIIHSPSNIIRQIVFNPAEKSQFNQIEVDAGDPSAVHPNDHLRDLIQKHHFPKQPQKPYHLSLNTSQLQQTSGLPDVFLSPQSQSQQRSQNQSPFNSDRGLTNKSPAAIKDKSMAGSQIHRLNRTFLQKQEFKKVSLQIERKRAELSQLEGSILFNRVSKDGQLAVRLSSQGGEGAGVGRSPKKSPKKSNIKTVIASARGENSQPRHGSMRNSLPTADQQRKSNKSERRDSHQNQLLRSPEEIFAEIAKRGIKPKPPQESEAVKKARQQLEVSAIVQDCQNRFSIETAKQKKRGKNKTLMSLDRCINGQLQTGQDAYSAMPDRQKMKNHFKQSEALKKQQLINELSNDSTFMAGILSVNDFKRKKNQSVKRSRVQEYVNHFSQAAEFMERAQTQNSAAHHFANALKEKLENNVTKIQLSDEVNQMMQQANIKRQMIQNIGMRPVKTEAAWGKYRQSIYAFGEEQDQMTLKNVAKNFSNNIEYQDRMKQRDIEEDFKQLKVEIPEIDPRIKYMKRCMQNLNMTLPVLDKIYRKTLCLQDYHLSDGNCEGLAEACEFLDTSIVNRMLFNNCGLSGDQLATILQGAQKMKDFKALIYRLSSVNALAIEKLGPIFSNPIPNHLEELQLIDCKLGATLIEQLMDSLTYNRAHLRKLAIVRPHHSERSFDKIVSFIQDDCLMEELDLSWSGIRPNQMIKLLRVIELNRYIKHLDLSYNELLLHDDQQTELTESQIIAGQTEIELSEFNQEVVTCFRDFIKYNLHLVHLNLERTGMIEPAIKYLTALLRKSQALRCLHLCGNPGLSDRLINWVRARIHAKPEQETVFISPPSEQVKYGSNTRGAPMNKRGLMKINRGQSLILQDKNQENQEWKDIRQGLKLRNIVQSMRIDDQSTMSHGVEQRKLIIQRHLGHKQLIQGIAQWGVYTHQKDECWICSNYIMTVFVWTPRIGHLAGEQDPKILEHYNREVDKLRPNWPIKPGNHDGAPYIYGPFTNWEPVRMKEAIPYCIDHDPLKPDFVQECINEQLINPYLKSQDSQAMTEEESKIVMGKQDAYYQEHWHRALLTLLRYKNPQVANRELYSVLTLKQDKSVPIFFHVDFCKPGKNIYMVEHSQKKGIQFVENFFDQLAFCDKMIKPNEALKSFNIDNSQNKPQIYIHKMLSQFRQEHIPEYHNPRHVRRFQSDLVQVKHVFKDWKEDEAEVLGQIFKHDWSHMLVSRLINDEDQQRRIKTELQANMYMLKEIYHQLQAISPSAPWVDANTVRKVFIDEMNIGNSNLLTNASLYNIILETCVQGERMRQEASQRLKKLCRYQFLEIVIRFSVHLYSNMTMRSGMHHSHDDDTEDNEFNELSASQAVYLFIENKIKPYYRQKDIQWQQFRDDQLWTHDIEMIYTLNEVNLKLLFKKYCKKNETTLSEEDIRDLFVRDSTMPISREMIREAFSMSKQTVVNETDPQQFADYNKARYVEFLELVGRVATILFRGTELENRTLQWKLEHVLQELFRKVHLEVLKNRIIIEEFSDSDDDY